jgi:hypothetical protein
MLISYYEDGTSAPKRMPRLLVALMTTNAGFAAAILFAWTYISLVVAEPLSWATWVPMSRGSGMGGVLEYPFLLLWLLPLVGILGGWVGAKGNRPAFAYAFVAIPIAMLALVFGWYYLAPTEWH